MDERGTSGDEGLDLILGGGLPVNGINLIMGLPGSGKTLLCQQFMFARATEAHPAIYLSTVSEPFEKILRYAQTLSFFDRQAIGRSVFYEDLGPAVSGEGGLGAVTERIANVDAVLGVGVVEDLLVLHVGQEAQRELVGPVGLELTPLCTWRDAHGERHAHRRVQVRTRDRPHEQDDGRHHQRRGHHLRPVRDRVTAEPGADHAAADGDQDQEEGAQQRIEVSGELNA